MGSILHHITPLVINSLGGGHTDTRRGQDRFLETRHAPACGWRAPGLKTATNFKDIAITIKFNFHL